MHDSNNKYTPDTEYRKQVRDELTLITEDEARK